MSETGGTKSERETILDLRAAIGRMDLEIQGYHDMLRAAVEAKEKAEQDVRIAADRVAALQADADKSNSLLFKLMREKDAAVEAKEKAESDAKLGQEALRLLVAMVDLWKAVQS